MVNNMAHMVKDVLSATETRETTKGFVTALLVVVAVLTTVDFLGVIEFRATSQSGWYSSDITMGFPNWKNPEYEIYISSIGEHAGSLVLTAEKTDGWRYNGTFYLGDTVLIGDWRVTIKEINMDREKPILLEYYKLVDLKILLVIALILLAIGTYYSWKG